MGLIERYIYAVTRRLPEKQREDIAKELRGLIEDMLAQRNDDSQADDADIEAVLTELGEPSALAAKYSGKPRYLIGPERFDIYIMVLKIVLVATAFGLLAALTVQYALTPPDNIGGLFENVISSVVSGVMEAFAWVTIIFAAVEHFSGNVNPANFKIREWKPSDLPDIPVKGALIKPSGSVVGIVFLVIFFILLNFSPELFSIYFSKNGVPAVTLFNLSVLKSYILYIDICFAVSMLKEIMKLVFGRYNIGFAVTNIILASISFILMLYVFSNIRIWNFDAVTYIENACGLSVSSAYEITQKVTVFARAFLGIVTFAYCVDIISTIAKTIRYSSPDLKKTLNRLKK